MTDLEAIFAQIHHGNELLQHKEYWEATLEFSRAQKGLKALINHQTDEKIRFLYSEQSNEYFDKARQTLIQALQEEIKQDESAETPVRLTLSDEQARERLLVFAGLFAKDDDVLLSSFVQTTKEQEFSLHERLAQLNQSLPKGFQTSDQRMREINKGLNRLGFSLYSSNDEANNKRYEPPKSTQEQVDEIIAQTRDEVAVTASNGGSQHVPVETTSSAHDDDDDSFSSNGNDESEASSETELDPEVIDSIRDKVVEAQAHLAQLLALLQADAEGDTEIEFQPQAGKHALQQARKLLNDSAREWKQK
jgi:hypothetical protein